MSFSTEAELSITVPESELRSARNAIEGGLGGVAAGVSSDGPAARATDGGTSAGGSARRGRRTLRWARQRTSLMEDTVMLLESIEDKVGEGGGGGLGGFLGGMGARSVLGGAAGAVGGAIGTVSLSAIVSKAPLRSLLKKAPAFATLVTAADLGSDLVTGNLTAQDIIEAPIELGEMLTFGMLDNDALEGAIGGATLTIGSVQLAKGLSSMLPSVGMGALLNPLTGSLVALLGGTLSLADVIDGDISGWNLPGRFGQAMGNAVRENFPEAADLIEQAALNNIFFNAGQAVRRAIEGEGGGDRDPTQPNLSPHGTQSWQEQGPDFGLDQADRQDAQQLQEQYDAMFGNNVTVNQGDNHVTLEPDLSELEDMAVEAARNESQQQIEDLRREIDRGR